MFEDKLKTFDGIVLVQIQKIHNIGAPLRASEEGTCCEEEEMGAEEKEEKFENKYLEACGNDKNKYKAKE
jgi:hypothetical protein